MTVATKVHLGPYPRFDHDEAIRLRKAGLSVRELAERYEISKSRIYQITNPRTRAMTANYKAWHQMTGVCVDCGQRGITRIHKRCRSCAHAAAVTTVRPDALKCAICHEWKWDTAFPWSSARQCEKRRGRHNTCTPCGTKLRQAHRERHKVPCACCGSPCLPAGEKGARAAPFPRCHPCFVAGRVPLEAAA